ARSFRQSLKSLSAPRSGFLDATPIRCPPECRHSAIARANVNRKACGLSRKSGNQQNRGAASSAPTNAQKKTCDLLFFLDGERHAGGDFAVELDGNVEFADGLDRVHKHDLALVDGVALGG